MPRAESRSRGAQHETSFCLRPGGGSRPLAPACVGSGDTASERALTLGEIRELTGLSAPIETAAAQQARHREYSGPVDSLILSTMRVEVVGPDDTRRFRWLPVCAGSRCELHDPVTDTSDTFDLATSPIVRGDAEAVGSAHGITLLSEIGQHMARTGPRSVPGWSMAPSGSSPIT